MQVPAKDTPSSKRRIASRVITSRTRQLRDAVTITMRSCAENGIGMEQIGTPRPFDISLSNSDLEWLQIVIRGKYLDATLREVDLNSFIPEEAKAGAEVTPDSRLLIWEGGLMDILGGTEGYEGYAAEVRGVHWDGETISTRTGKPQTKRARKNICVAEFRQELDLASKAGTVHHFDDMPVLSGVRDTITNLLNAAKPKDDPDYTLLAEGNLYDDYERSGQTYNKYIGWHGDTEDHFVVGMRSGFPVEVRDGFPLKFVGMRQRKRVTGPELEFDLFPGDIYFMTRGAAGSNWRKTKSGKKDLITWRHCAGFGPSKITSLDKFPVYGKAGDATSCDS